MLRIRDNFKKKIIKNPTFCKLSSGYRIIETDIRITEVYLSLNASLKISVHSYRKKKETRLNSSKNVLWNTTLRHMCGHAIFRFAENQARDRMIADLTLGADKTSSCTLMANRSSKSVMDAKQSEHVLDTMSRLA